MSPYNVLRMALVLGAALVASAAVASEKISEKRVAADAADTPEKFSQLVAGVHQEMASGGRYEFIRPDDKAKVNIDLDAMSAMLQKSGSVATMSQEDKVRLFNLQEHVNGMLVHNDANRLICERRPPMGSNIPVTTCKTFGELKKMRRDSEKYMTDHASDANRNHAAMNSLVGDRMSSGHQ